LRGNNRVSAKAFADPFNQIVHGIRVSDRLVLDYVDQVEHWQVAY